MGITYQIDSVDRLVRIHWEGPVDLACVRDHWLRLTADEAALACGRSLADVRQAEFLITGPELDRLVQTLLRPSLQGRAWKTAVLVDAAVQVGISRQYSVFLGQGPQGRDLPA